MSNQYIRLPPSSTGLKADLTELTVDGQVVERERINIAGSTDVALAEVTNSAPTTEYGLVVRPIPSGTQTVTGPLTDAQLRATAVPVSLATAPTTPVTGTFWQATQPVSVASLPLPTGAATASKQDTGNTSLASIDGKITAVNTGAVVVSSSALPSGASTSSKQDTGNTSLASIDGKITAVNTGAVVVSSSALPTGAATGAKQDTGNTAIALLLTDTQLRATPVPVSLASAPTTAVTNAGLTNLDVALSTRTKPSDQQHAIIDSGTTVVTQPTGTNLHVVVDAAPTTAVTGPLTDTQLRATAVTVSGTVATGGLTDTQLRASAVPVSLAVAPSTPVTNASLTSIDGKIVAVDTTNVTVGASALPSGAATSSRQDTEIASLATIAALSKAEDAASASSDTGIPFLATRKDDLSPTLQSSDGDYAPVTTDAAGNLHIVDFDSGAMRRMQEASQLLQLQASINALIASESETSQRYGFEIR